MTIELDVDTPEACVKALREAAEAYFSSSDDLRKEWGEKKAGKIWNTIGNILDTAADKIEEKIAKET